MLDLTLYGEKVLEWNAEDTLVYRGKRLAMDSILCEFKQYYRPERLDSLFTILSPCLLSTFLSSNNLPISQ